MRTQSICLALAIILLCPFASAQWVKTSLPDTLAVYCFAVSGTNLFAGTEKGVFLSTNNGTSWTSTSLTIRVLCLAVNGTNLFAGTEPVPGQTSSGVFLSTNNGASWTAVNNELTNTGVLSLAVSGANLFAGTGGGVSLSTDNGTNWTATGLTKSPVSCFAVSGTNIFAGGPYASGVYLSTNNGASWTADGLTNYTVFALAVSGTNILAGASWFWKGDIRFNYVFHSTNNDTNWTAVNTGLPSPAIWCFAVSGTNIFAGGPYGVILSSDNGTSWTAAGLTNTDVQHLAVSDTNLFAETMSSGVWRRPLSEMVTSVERSRNIPSHFSLEQNYPNPFNPSTTIKYELLKSSVVRLSVYDMLGREVSVLVNESRDAGVHEVKFDGSNLASGVYFYRLQAGDFTQTKRLLLLK